ncbi:hypothetical protein ANO11243_045730 [Dothideomycetidae sp. 11243]|nr:hypothetical protein ANO11243_045730 [fungal sp. No.11243]
MQWQVAYIYYIGFVIGYASSIQIHGLENDFWYFLNLAALWELPFGLTTVLVRGAIATFFLRALPKVEHTGPRIAIITIFWFYAVFMTVFIFINMFQCGNPFAESWAYTPPCLSYSAMEALPIVARVLTMVLDWLMTLTPVIVVLRSAMSRRDKVSVISIMVLAGIGSTLSILSIVFYRLGNLADPDTFPGFMVYTIFTLWENGAAIIAVSLAAMRPLVSRIVEGTPWSGPGGLSIPLSPGVDDGNAKFNGRFNDNVVHLDKFEVEPPQSPKV